MFAITEFFHNFIIWKVQNSSKKVEPYFYYVNSKHYVWLQQSIELVFQLYIKKFHYSFDLFDEITV